MLDWLKNIFCKDQMMKSAATNKYYIEKYKDFDKIIATMYQMKDANGKSINIDGIVTPLKIDNRQMCAVTDDQATTPHCAGYSICNLCESLIWKKTGKLINLNADQVYAKAKQIDNDINSDGTTLEASIKAAMTLGGFGSQSNSMKIGYIYNYKNDATIQMIKRNIHKYSFLHAGFNIDDGWYDATNSNYIIKKGKYAQCGHAILLVGYDQTGVYIQNSWSKSWGSKGFAILPWDLVKEQLIYCCYIENFIA